MAVKGVDMTAYGHSELIQLIPSCRRRPAIHVFAADHNERRWVASTRSAR